YGGGLYDGFLTKLYPHLPGPVENLTCENQNYSVRLRWTPPRDTGGVPIDGYIIYRGASPGALTEFRRVGNVTEFVDGYYDMRRTYYYRVRAYTIGGMGGLSPVANGTPYTPPREPQGLTGDVNGANVTLTWQEPLDDGGWPVTHYRIYRSSDNVYFTYVGSTRGTNFTETGLPPGRSYYYYVTAVNYVGEGRKSNILAIYLYTYPSEPVDLKVVPLEGKIMISWLPPHFDGGTPVMSYRVYRSAGTSPFELYEEVPVGTRILYDRNVSYGVRYFYYVTAVNAYGEGGRSDIGSAIPGKIPSPVTDLRAVPERDRVTLLWSEPVDISGYEILDYYLYRSVNGGGMELVAVVQGTVWVDVDVRLGYTYRYGIEARNIWGLSERSLSGEIVIGEAPGEVSYFSIAGGKKAVYLSWDEPENTGGVPVKGYIIYKGVLGGELELYLTLPPDETGYTDSDVIPGVRYVYAVCAYNEFGEGRRVYGEAIPYTFPDPPRDFRGEAGDGWVELSWEEPLFDGGRPIEGYMIYWQASGELEWRIEIVGPEVRAYHIGGLTNGLVYRFSIRSFTSVAESELTEIIELKPSSVPQAPGSISATYEVGGVLIVWSQPGDTGGSEIKGYRIYRSVGGGELELLVELGPTAFRYRDDKVLKGEVYAYAVAAFSDVGEGRRSRVVSVFPATPPGVVKGFTAIGMGMDHVDLFWEGVDDSGGYPLTGYVIYRGLSPANMVKLIELPAGSRSFSDTTVEAGKEYYYIIRAENALGEGEQSDYLSVEVKGVPGDVKDFSVKYSKKDKAVLLTWSGVENDGGSEVTGYIIYRGEEGGAVREYAMVDGDARMYVDRDVKDGVRYTYRIRAVNAEGVGSAVERSVYVPSKLWQFFVMGLLGLIPILGLYLFDYIKKRGRGKKAAEEPTAKGPEGLTPPWSPPAAVVRKPPLPPPQHSPPSEGGKEETEVKYIPPQEGG
ncbi:MAG: fibronectin type III domain-containing protein, partial [Thermoplasmata archaeon]|nr:fibronectin type III domain-containing protein [Thermoplasmata archaeon]